MHSVRALLEKKGSEVWSVGPRASVYSALELMAEKNIGALIVVEDEHVLGIFSERDYARDVVLRGRTSTDTPVEEIMSGRVIYVEPDNTVEECMALMADKHFRHLPVLENDRLVGVLSIGDVVNAVIDKQDFKIKELANHITGQDYFSRF
jgi:CBS domain-containing protein